MKIFQVTMKSLGDYWVQERLKYAELEKALDGEAHPDRPSHLDRAKDVSEISNWRQKFSQRKELIERIGIIIPDRKPVSEEAEEFKRNEYLNSPTFVCTGEQLLLIMEVDDSITVKSCAPIAGDSHEGLLARLEAVVEKLEKIDIPNPADPPAHIFNEHCEVHLPGNLLATYNETLLLEDACTDELQGALNSGWRMVAVCPQSQRRPDYILGRFNPNLAAPGGAARSA